MKNNCLAELILRDPLDHFIEDRELKKQEKIRLDKAILEMEKANAEKILMEKRLLAETDDSDEALIFILHDRFPIPHISEIQTSFSSIMSISKSNHDENTINTEITRNDGIMNMGSSDIQNNRLMNGRGGRGRGRGGRRGRGRFRGLPPLGSGNDKKKNNLKLNENSSLMGTVKKFRESVQGLGKWWVLDGEQNKGPKPLYEYIAIEEMGLQDLLELLRRKV